MSTAARATETVTPTALLDRVRERRAAADRAEADLLVLATEWADAHPDLDDEPYPAKARRRRANPLADQHGPDIDDPEIDEEEHAWYGIPSIAWDAPAAFAVANRMSTAAGKAMIRDGLVLRHRLPGVWTRVQAGQVAAWRARRIAQAVLGQPDDVCDHLDGELAPMAHKVGPVTLDRKLDEALLLLHAEERELAQLEALDSRYARLIEDAINHNGIAEMIVRGDWKDLHDFDQALTRVAAVLREHGCEESLNVRRSMAVGILADPARAAALLADEEAPAPRKRLTLVLQLSEYAVLGLDPVGRNLSTDRAVLADQIREWAGRSDTHVTVRPVLHVSDPDGEAGPRDGYRIPSTLAEQVRLTSPRCVFPYCDRAATPGSYPSDLDHRLPHDRGGPTDKDNLAPLCRHHHRLKTHAGWGYTLVEPGIYLWTSPHGEQFLRDRGGTLDVTRIR